MALSKRLRYEILRRDGNACRYCGACAPEVTLTVDHVIPTALGGSDQPENLVAACRDCNAGKSASSPDSALVADVAEEALLWRQLTEVAGAQLRAERAASEEFVGEALSLWAAYCSHWSAPRDAANSLEKMYAAGAVAEDVAYAASVTASTFGVTYHWSYFCGIVWKHIKRRDELAQQMYRQAHDGTDA